MNILNEGTVSVFPGLYIHMWSKYTRADIDETFDFLRLLSSLNLCKNGSVHLLGRALNRSNTVLGVVTFLPMTLFRTFN